MLKLLLPLILSLGATIARAATGQPLLLYVATNGNDAWSGREPSPNRGKSDGPLATVAHALEIERALKHDVAGDRPITIFIRSGSYHLTEPLRLNPEDSG